MSPNSSVGVSRHCPRCRSELVATRYAALEIDRCTRCAGVFLDVGEAAYTLGPQAEAHAWRDEPEAREIGPASSPCPAGHGGLTAYQVGTQHNQVHVDACQRCHGIWLDRHEGKRLQRALHGLNQRFNVAPPDGGKHGLKWYLFQPRSGSWTHPSVRLPSWLARHDEAAGPALQRGATTPGGSAEAQSGA